MPGYLTGSLSFNLQYQAVPGDATVLTQMLKDTLHAGGHGLEGWEDGYGNKGAVQVVTKASKRDGFMAGI